MRDFVKTSGCSADIGLEKRRQKLDAAAGSIFDVVVIGSGSSGAAVFRQLARAGFRTLLSDKGDFAGGTSQSSAMMIWGNLPDIARTRFVEVGRMCAARDRLIENESESVTLAKFLYLPASDCTRRPLAARAAHYAYWGLAAGRRSFPQKKTDFPERSFLKAGRFRYSFEYEEARIESSDARLVFDWAASAESFDRIALNYFRVEAGHFDAARGMWKLSLKDSVSESDITVRTKWVINAAGVWADRVNECFGIRSPFKHVLGKGVFIAIPRPSEHHSPLMIESRGLESCMGLIPWGPVSLWGPTERQVDDLDAAFSVETAEVRFLLEKLNDNLAAPLNEGHIVSLRCGVRPLVTDRTTFYSEDTSAIPREFRVHESSDRNWATIYGGKLTSSQLLAAAVVRLVGRRIKPSAPRIFHRETKRESPETCNFPGLPAPVPTAKWCAENEMCYALEDYLRRRTNIAQWIPRAGLGTKNENRPLLAGIARELLGDADAAQRSVVEYERKVEKEFDLVIACAPSHSTPDPDALSGPRRAYDAACSLISSTE